MHFIHVNAGVDNDFVQSEGSTSSRPETPTLHTSQHDSVIISELRERNQSLEKAGMPSFSDTLYTHILATEAQRGIG